MFVDEVVAARTETARNQDLEDLHDGLRYGGFEGRQYVRLNLRKKGELKLPSLLVLVRRCLILHVWTRELAAK
jgi:hypothetical protein